MHFLAWNLCQRRAMPALASVVAANAPKLLMLQEAVRPLGWIGDAVGAAVPGEQWGSWLLAREGTLTPIAVPEYTGWLTGATWIHGAHRVACFSLHAPSGTDESYVAECLKMVDLIDREVGRTAPVVIGGDFNFKSFGERAENDAPANTKEELQALAQFDDRGYAVAWRSANHGAPLPQTLRWSRNRLTPYHCDGFLVRGLGITSCKVLPTENIGFPSDHDPVLVELVPAGAA